MDSFLNTFYRMASRRGLADEVYSENGTNFIGADRELQALLAQVESHKIEQSQDRIDGKISEKGDKGYPGTG